MASLLEEHEEWVYKQDVEHRLSKLEDNKSHVPFLGLLVVIALVVGAVVLMYERVERIEASIHQCSAKVLDVAGFAGGSY